VTKWFSKCPGPTQINCSKFIVAKICTITLLIKFDAHKTKQLKSRFKKSYEKRIQETKSEKMKFK
tara:strand:+ start:196 stop:390 length:195 start_codon:yes stop_codon:yes gene_type:complete